MLRKQSPSPVSSGNAIRWLHLSDLHLGQPGKELWRQIRGEFRESIRKMVSALGLPRLILLTGDLVFSGRPEEYKLVDQFLQELNHWLGVRGSPAPLVLAVPGNHDLARPADEDLFRFEFLGHYWEDHLLRFRQQLWEKENASQLLPLFAAWDEWAGRALYPPLGPQGELHRSFFPGDFSFVLGGAGGYRLGIIGLNSAWTHYRSGNLEQQLELPLQQLQAALPRPEGELEHDFFSRCTDTLLLLHHPPDWLSERSRRDFHEGIHSRGQVALCLHGHMHCGASRSESLFGGEARICFQASSLFGLEHYGTKEEERSFGYAWGEIRPDGAIRVLPLVRVKRGNGSHCFDTDQHFTPEDDGWVQLRPPQRVPAQPRPSPLHRTTVLPESHPRSRLTGSVPGNSQQVWRTSAPGGRVSPGLLPAEEVREIPGNSHSGWRTLSPPGRRGSTSLPVSLPADVARPGRNGSLPAGLPPEEEELFEQLRNGPVAEGLSGRGGYHIYLSYSRRGEWPAWVEDSFLPLLEHWLTEDLWEQPRIFDDPHPGDEDGWPLTLDRAHRLSRVLVCLLTPTYFHNPRCINELARMRMREERLGYRTLQHPTGLILPFILHGETFPVEAARLESVDIRECANVRIARGSPTFETLSRRIREWMPRLALAIRQAPDLDPDPGWESDDAAAFISRFEHREPKHGMPSWE